MNIVLQGWDWCGGEATGMSCEGVCTLCSRGGTGVAVWLLAWLGRGVDTVLQGDWCGGVATGMAGKGCAHCPAGGLVWRCGYWHGWEGLWTLCYRGTDVTCASIAVKLLYAIPILTVTISVHTVTNMYGSHSC